MTRYVSLLFFMILLNCRTESSMVLKEGIITGAEQFGLYLPELKNKAVGLVANHTSLVGATHLADTLISQNINIARIFAPEHGFRGTAGAGDIINDTVDVKTGKPVISLYGANMKPSADQLKGLDIMIYDIQDVGVRFYTYISTMHYVMEACAEQGIQLIILDRPDPLGHYVDGPVLDSAYRTFVGMHPLPVVYGMTAGELALMINSEGWLKNGVKCRLKVVPCSNYDHQSIYALPVNPSPNLNSMEAVYLYPSVCFFEGTIMSVGRGTDHPFRIIGHPDYPDKSFSFVPTVNPSNKNPLLLDSICYGIDLRSLNIDTLIKVRGLNIEWLLTAYRRMDKGEDFFTGYFDKLAGTDNLRKQIIGGLSSEEIISSWQDDLSNFKAVRKKYLLYKDFE